MAPRNYLPLPRASLHNHSHLHFEITTTQAAYHMALHRTIILSPLSDCFHSTALHLFGRLPTQHERQASMAGGPHIDRLKTKPAEHLVNMLGVMPPPTEAQHA